MSFWLLLLYSCFYHALQRCSFFLLPIFFGPVLIMKADNFDWLERNCSISQIQLFQLVLYEKINLCLRDIAVTGLLVQSVC